MTLRPFTDAGHGGPEELGTHDELAVVRDDGSCVWHANPSGLIEKDVVLDIENRIHRSLDCAPLTVGRSRHTDTERSQGERGRASMQHGAGFVASLHVNDNHDPRASGAQLYVYPRNRRTFGLANEVAGPLALIFGKCDVIQAHKPPDPDEEGITEEERKERLKKKWINAPRAILLAHACDAILAELGFRRNERDRKILMSELGREEIASVMRWLLVRSARGS